MRYPENPADVAYIMEGRSLSQVYADRYVAMCEGMFETGLQGLGNIAVGLFQTVAGAVEAVGAPVMNILSLGLAADDFERLLVDGLTNILHGVTKEIAGIVQVGGSILQISGSIAKAAGEKAEELVQSVLLNNKSRGTAKMDAAYKAIEQVATTARKATEQATLKLARSKIA